MKIIRKIIIKFKIVERNFYRKFYQRIADTIIDKLKHTKSQSDFDYLLSLGVQIDFLTKNKNIYLK